MLEFSLKENFLTFLKIFLFATKITNLKCDKTYFNMAVNMSPEKALAFFLQKIGGKRRESEIFSLFQRIKGI